MYEDECCRFPQICNQHTGMSEVEEDTLLRSFHFTHERTLVDHVHAAPFQVCTSSIPSDSFINAQETRQHICLRYITCLTHILNHAEILITTFDPFSSQ